MAMAVLERTQVRLTLALTLTLTERTQADAVDRAPSFPRTLPPCHHTPRASPLASSLPSPLAPSLPSPLAPALPSPLASSLPSPLASSPPLPSRTLTALLSRLLTSPPLLASSLQTEKARDDSPLAHRPSLS